MNRISLDELFEEVRRRMETSPHRIDVHNAMMQYIYRVVEYSDGSGVDDCSELRIMELDNIYRDRFGKL